MHRVVVADDDPEFLGWFRSLLDSSGDFEVVGEAKDGVETLDLVLALMPDLVITDIYMPDPDGIAVAHQINQNFPSTKAIIISVQEGRIYDEMAIKEGALAFIPKRKLSLNILRQALQT
jgi:DNA-binding NarL/FixJ family response regulator